ncbi:MAG: hypothetical protein ACRBDL_02195 [Alphaproteobacteria bacterium]
MDTDQVIIDGLHIAHNAAASYISYQAALLFVLGLILFAVGAFIGLYHHSRAPYRSPY